MSKDKWTGPMPTNTLDCQLLIEELRSSIAGLLQSKRITLLVERVDALEKELAQSKRQSSASYSGRVSGETINLGKSKP